MLRKFKISIDGKEYLVEMEEIGGEQRPVAPPVAPVSEPVQSDVTKKAPVSENTPPAPVNQPIATANSETLTAPMPGTILKLLVNQGDAVTANQPVMILEAMKMENEIVAPKDGTVAEIFVQVGAIVNASDPLIAFN